MLNSKNLVASGSRIVRKIASSSSQSKPCIGAASSVFSQGFHFEHSNLLQKHSLLQRLLSQQQERFFSSNLRQHDSKVDLSGSNYINILDIPQVESEADSEGFVTVKNIRNLAIIAHVDTGKTTMIDCLLKQTGTIKDDAEERTMDSLDLEKERGITIMAKLTSVQYKGEYIINIVDTPGHADFSGEVERVMSMVDGVCLLVDATEGVMAQTKFVLRKALEHGLKPIVIFNKSDRETARIGGEVENEVYDLFIDLGANDEQLDFPILYASAKSGWAVKDFEKDERKNTAPIFEAILEHIPCPKVRPSAASPFQMLVSTVDYDRIFGRIVTGKMYGGAVKPGDRVKVMSRTGEVLEEGKVLQVMQRIGMQRTPVKRALSGSIVSIAGISKASVTDTVCDVKQVTTPIEAKPIDPPILSVMFLVNDSPLAGKEGKLCSATQLRARLLKEAEMNVSLTIKPMGEAFEIMGRGEMQLAVLIENMRREGYEFQVSPPRVIFKDVEGGGKDDILEPIEEVTIDVDNGLAAQCMEKLAKRKGEMIDYKVDGIKAKLLYRVPTRGLIGYASEFRTDTRGEGMLTHIFSDYEPYKGPIEKTRKGVMVSLEGGKGTPYALGPLEARGNIFIHPSAECYEGMIVGEHSRENDIEVNPCKEKHLTNMRAAGKEDTIRLSPPRVFQLEEVLTYIQQDELIEVTPKNIRLRKKVLGALDRKMAKRKEK
ncbi:GTPase [Naegleria gruberi]|uniref:GTPase n=1 Tax=Naegleria gruberi TaxID=5762 RepID=D2VA03_NAEGR|nr:GTPase [Naegleria gruberi]EFC46341.1 GTPase [Naegleria gruberi]|eukprot:XP_002679085.1 GTPase [Naegleria gruberi]